MDDGYPESSSPSPRSSGTDSSQDDNGRLTSATSPSSHEASVSPRTVLSRSESLWRETVSFLSDLDNYVPLGCLTFEDLAELDDDQDADKWRDVTQHPPFMAFDHGLSYSLQKLTNAGYIRIWSKRSSVDSRFLIFRIYILPFDVGHRFIDRQSKKLDAALENLLLEIDTSSATWDGQCEREKTTRFDLWASKDEGSLFWMFNKLPSPSPCPQLVKEKYAREALEDLLDPVSVLPGLRTQLYPYQRRSAGMMLQRESVSTLDLDPRLEQRTAPDGSTFCFGARDLAFFRHPRYYEACKGGVLAETMGLGKTVICLATILATKDHYPLVPPPFNLPPTRSAVASLSDMAMSAINRKSVPWRVEFSRVQHATGNDLESCRKKLEHSPPFYEIPVEPMRWNRKTILPPPKKMTLAATTIIVVPRNLCKQWQLEMHKHVDAETLRVLVMEDSRRALPFPAELRTYDVVLFTRGRFEMEIRDGADEKGRRLGATQLLCRCPYIGATRTRDCHCIRSDELYDSPLKYLHFKRLIIDEGHFFSNKNTAAVSVADKLITADHRWVVSGTPAKDLLGVEVDVSAAENLGYTADTKDSREAVLEQRRHFSKKDDTNGAIKSLGGLASSFLKIKPWSAPDSTERRADWEEYIYRHEDLRRRTYSGFSTCLKRTLEQMVIKTQPEDVEKDINLPPLSHEVVHLEPSFFDKTTANLFTLVLTANAITSERTDMDYLFHRNSQKSRSQLILNLRQSAFFWTGFSEADVLASLKSSHAYLAKEGTGCTDSDRQLLAETLACADTILESKGWKSMSKSHELGLFVHDWPSDTAEHWAFDESYSPLLTGLSQLLEAQKYVNERTGQENPGDGLAGAGIKALAPARYGTAKEEDETQRAEKSILTKAGIPTSSINGEPVLKRRTSFTAKGSKVSPKKPQREYKVVKTQKRNVNRNSAPDSELVKAAQATSTQERRPGLLPRQHTPKIAEGEASLSADSPFLRSRIVGTTSAKLSYLLSQIIKYYQQEKIIVFYDGENVAYYIAQALDLFHIKHEIYAKSLAAYLKAEYVVRFNQEEQDRVLLMDVRNAAHGLNISSASRIYFVNPVCRPNIEAQAIKRAHRIGQTRKVFVETLVLKGTIEEKMLERSKRMTQSEHQDAKIHLEDDGGIRKIIQSAEILPIADHEKTGYGQMAALEAPQQLWGRPGWREFSESNHWSRANHTRKRTMSNEAQAAVQHGTFSDDEHRTKRVARRYLDYVDLCGSKSVSGQREIEDTDDEPILNRWRRNSIAAAHAPPTQDPPRSRAEDAFLPQTKSISEAESFGISLQPVSSRFAGIQQGAPPDQGYCKLPITQLLNNESECNLQYQPASPGLLQRILQWL